MAINLVNREELGRLGREEFRIAMGIARDERQNHPETRIACITKELQKLETLGMTPGRMSLLQNKILEFASSILSLHYRLNNDKRALNAKIAASGMSLETFTEFKKQSRQYIAIRNLSDAAYKLIQRMNDHLYSVINGTIDRMSPDNITQSRMETFERYLDSFNSFNNQTIDMLDRHLDEVDHRLLNGEETNYLWFCRQDLEARWDQFLQEHREEDDYITDKLDQSVAKVLFIDKMRSLLSRWRS